MNNISNGLESSVPVPEGRATVIVEQVGQRRLSLVEHENGVTELQLAPAPIAKLILSGGGAKGVAYSGAITALQRQGALEGIDALYGSSAGAIMAALIASGMDADQFDALSDNTHLLSLLDSPDENTGWIQKAFSSAGTLADKALPGTVGNVTRLLLSVLPRVQSNAQPLQTLIRDTARAALLGRIRDEHPAEVLVVRERLLADGAVIFADLALLGRYIPQIKSLNITGTVMFGGQPQLVVFSAALTPDMDIALAAHISAALPVVFKRPAGQGLAFQELDELTFFQDGGVLLNTPVPQLMDPGLVTDLLSGSDMLILQFEQQQAASNRGGFMALLTDWLTGTPVAAELERQNLNLKAFEQQTVVVPLRTEMGDFTSTLSGTLNFTMTADIKNHLQERLQQAVEKHLVLRAEKRERYVFATVDEALLSMDDDMLGSIWVKAPESAVSGVLAWRAAADDALVALEDAVRAVDAGSRLHMTDGIRSALDELDTMAVSPAHVQWLALQLNRFDRPACVRLLEAMRNETVESPVLNAALIEKRVREIRVIAGNIRKSVIFPSLHLFMQTAANTGLLLRADQLLLKATTDDEINRTLDTIIEGYSSRAPVAGQWWTPHVVELARSWRINRGDKESQ
ncbi:patatin-like phospholipase family protein [Pseudomonas sp. CDFA 602]|uniref:patatin-like phospholipase family protein n=1 Tax=Pseudomonas californiensis TaxID=2829823 RepID=UPI001E43F524|nr:patatin-like phospholipase family protein [Pseudomonas californiensis]MCD5992367.1 patatin-like phospholipase family protein [Pseudomonas californiensis]MCD5997975.1 patatin-like phospholipase family protein [Pseudomonas californiensis]